MGTLTVQDLTAGREHWNQNANYCGTTRYAAERGHHAAVQAGNYWIVCWTNERTGVAMWSDLSAHGLALGMAKDLVRNPGSDRVMLATLTNGQVVRVADEDEIQAARY